MRTKPIVRGASCTPTRTTSILKLARENGARHHTFGLNDLLLSVRPVETLGRRRGPVVAGGYEITITPVGKPIDPHAAAALLDWATAYVERNGAP
jgi:hypothetical protein